MNVRERLADHVTATVIRSIVNYEHLSLKICESLEDRDQCVFQEIADVIVDNND
jgi:hypothetical protein